MHFAVLGIISIVNPTQLIAISLAIKYGGVRRKLKWLLAGMIIGSLIMFMNGVDSKYYFDLYFPETM